MREGYIINIGQTALQVTLCWVAVIFMFMKRRTGWVAAFAILTLYTFLGLYVASNAVFSGFMDTIVLLGGVVSLMLLLALIFLIVPSTIRKFNINKWSVIAAVILLVLLGSLSWFSTE